MTPDGRAASLRGGLGSLRASVFLVGAGLLLQGTAQAVTTQSFKVGATIAPGCSVVSGSGGVLGSLNFGTHTGVESGRATTSFVPNSALSLGCTPGVTLSMSIDGGQHFASVRNMQRSGGTQQVPYRLYSSSTFAANTEIGVNQTISVAISNSNNIALSLYGAAQLTGFSPAGSYTDQLTVTLSW